MGKKEGKSRKLIKKCKHDMNAISFLYQRTSKWNAIKTDALFMNKSCLITIITDSSTTGMIGVLLGLKKRWLTIVNSFLSIKQYSQDYFCLRMDVQVCFVHVRTKKPAEELFVRRGYFFILCTGCPKLSSFGGRLGKYGSCYGAAFESFVRWHDTGCFWKTDIFEN